MTTRAGQGSEVAAARLLPLDGLEQRLEVALAEPLGPVPLDQLEEHRGPVLNRLGEDLQQVAVLVPVGQDAELSQLARRHPGLAHPRADLALAATGSGPELPARRAPGGDAGHYALVGER